MYSSLTAVFGVKLQGERCTIPTFSRIHILHACLLQNEGPGVLRLACPRRYITFGLRGPSEVMVLKVPSSSDQSSPSSPKAIPSVLKVLISKPVPLSDQLSPSHPKVGSLVWGDLASDGRPSGVLAFFRWSPAIELGSVFEGGIDLWESIRRSNPQHKPRIKMKSI